MIVISTLALLLGLTFIAQPSPRPGTSYPGDKEFAILDYPGALEKYDSVRAHNSGDPDLLWRMARLYVCMGDVARRSERRELYLSAERYARACIQSDSSVSEGHTWLAASLGTIAMFEGSERKVEL
jgi:hypothetical protein